MAFYGNHLVPTCPDRSGCIGTYAVCGRKTVISLAFNSMLLDCGRPYHAIGVTFSHESQENYTIFYRHTQHFFCIFFLYLFLNEAKRMPTLSIPYEDRVWGQLQVQERSTKSGEKGERVSIG